NWLAHLSLPTSRCTRRSGVAPGRPRPAHLRAERSDGVSSLDSARFGASDRSSWPPTTQPSADGVEVAVACLKGLPLPCGPDALVVVQPDLPGQTGVPGTLLDHTDGRADSLLDRNALPHESP